MKLRTILIIGLVWPEQISSAAGKRMVQLIKIFTENSYKVIFVSAASESDYSEDLLPLNVICERIVLNSDTFDKFLQNINPTIVLFDRFVMEEQYGWRVAEKCPDAIRILDTEDLHFLRAARNSAIKANRNLSDDDLLSEPVATREIASILRCDLTLIISEVEVELLQRLFNIDASLLHYIPLLAEQDLDVRSFESRNDFLFIGNFLHFPNLDAVRHLKSEIWPELRDRVPTAKLIICGAYPTQEVLQMHSNKSRIVVKGRVPDSIETIRDAKVMLAPIRTGAGIKGKLLEAISTGTPSVTTSIGAEGIAGVYDWPGAICENVSDFVNAATLLYQSKEAWNSSQRNRVAILKRFDEKNFVEDFLLKIVNIQQNISQHRNRNFYGKLLQHHTMTSTKYMSLWISEKNKQ